MKTEQLIAALAADIQPKRRLVFGESRAIFGTLLTMAAFMSLALLLGSIGIRPDIMAALTTWRFDVKLLSAALVAAFGLLVSLRALRPTNSSLVGWLILASISVVSAGVVMELLAAPSETWQQRLVGRNALWCLTWIPILSVLPFVVLMRFLQTGAPRSPVAAGAAAGLTAAAIGAFIYGIHCDDDSPLFVATWYSLAVAIVAGGGAIFGRRYLRW